MEQFIRALLAAIETCASKPLWPGFDPLAMPVAIFDGDRTWLIGHPAPPSEFSSSGIPEVMSVEGQHPSVHSNTAASLGGVLTATAVLPSTDRPVEEWAPLVIHEAFHVYQRLHHPEWSANEVHLLSYPEDDVAILSLALLEIRSLSRALACSKDYEAARWAATAVVIRHRKNALLPANAAAYEQATETHEGLARYVEFQARANSHAASQNPPEPDGANVRDRCYWTGWAIATLLDRFSVNWSATFNDAGDVSLHTMLARAMTQLGAVPEDVPTAEEQEAAAKAARFVARRRAQREEQRRAFLGRSGWAVTVDASDAQPMAMEMFDPMNLHVLGKGEVLHTRLLTVSHPAIRLAITGTWALTRSNGTSPITDGICHLMITGLQHAPVTIGSGDEVRLNAQGLDAHILSSVLNGAPGAPVLRIEHCP